MVESYEAANRWSSENIHRGCDLPTQSDSVRAPGCYQNGTSTKCNTKERVQVVSEHKVQKSEFPPNLEGLTKYWQTPPPEKSAVKFVLFKMEGSDFMKETWEGLGSPDLLKVPNLFWKAE